MSDNKNNDTPKFEFSAGTGFNPGSGQGAGSDDQVVTVTDGIQSISIEQPTAADGEGEEEDAGGDFMNLPKVIIKRVTAIRRMHVTYEEIDNEYKKERLELEKKYLERKQVLLDARNKIISGETEAPSSADEPDQVAALEGGEEDVKGIPGFWPTCLSSHPTIGDLITEEDIPALEALTDISVAYEDDWTTFTLTFHFRENEFFTNKELSKRYVISPDLLDDKAPALSESTGTDIDWKPSKNLCITEIKKKQKAKSGRNKGQVRTVITTEPKPSFFQYFSSPMTEEEEEEAAENEDEDHEPVRLNMEEDYDIGHAIRTSLIPEAVLWYTGEAVDDDDEDDDEEEEEEDEEEEDEDEDGDDDEDDDDEDEDDSPPKGKGKGKGGGKQGGSKGKGKGGGLTFTPEGGFSAGGGGAAGGGAGGEQPECKQN